MVKLKNKTKSKKAERRKRLYGFIFQFFPILAFRILVFSFIIFSFALADYPSKPIKIIVHTKPGGAVDLMARQFAQIAGQKSDQSFVVVNKPGGSGLLALANVFNEKADGYSLLAFPAAYLAPIQTTDIGFGLEDFDYLACLTISPEAIITNKHSDIKTMDQILAHAMANPNEQKWCGPGSGSLDHLMGVKIWDKAGITAKWIPYGGGGPAIASVMGKHNHVYVGNPEDIIGRRENLYIAAIASEERHPTFPDAPTFKEFGIDLTTDVMWRGFAVKKGTDPEVVSYLKNLLRQVSEDSAWKQFIQTTGVQSVFISGDEFRELVFRDAESSKTYLLKSGFTVGTKPKSAPMSILTFIIITVIIISGLHFYTKQKHLSKSNVYPIAGVGFAIAITFIYMSTYFPAPRTGTMVGAATVPQVWAAILLIMSGMVVFQQTSKTEGKNSNFEKVKLVFTLISFLTIYVLIISILGFLPSTAIMLVGGMLILKHKEMKTVFATTAIVIGLLYGIFYLILQVPLPTGMFF